MSDAPRMELRRGIGAAANLIQRWRLIPPACLVVGSIRRKRAEIGDIDFIAPVPAGKIDPLYDLIAPDCLRAEDLFAGETQAFAQEVSGLKPGFLSCHLKVQFTGAGPDDPPIVLPVQINRYTPQNRGWIEIMKTGPRDFGIWFLSTWKTRWSIPTGEAGKASIDGHLVDRDRRVVGVTTEEEAFHKCGVTFVPPEERDAFMVMQARRREQYNRETLR